MSSDEDSSAFDLNHLPREHFIKILVLGDSGVGKSSLIKKYCFADSSIPQYKVSVAVSHASKSLNLGENDRAHLQLWDIPGHERFGGMTRIYYKYAHGVAIVFDLARPETFEGALSWLSDVTQKLFDEKQELAAAEAAASNRHCSAEDMLKANRTMPVILLANKCDLASLKVPRQKYSSYVQENGLLAWSVKFKPYLAAVLKKGCLLRVFRFETSSKEPGSMTNAMKNLVEFILESDPEFQSKPSLRNE